jgi:hypothetical protein
MSAFPFIVLLLAQSPAVPAAGAPQLDRVREAVAGTPAITIPATIPAAPDDSGKPVFRVKVQAWTFKGHPWDQDATVIPDYVRPSMPLPHYEFLQMVTPEAFRASTLYPGFGFDPVIFKNLFKGWRHSITERNAREEVRRDFEAYLQARATDHR